MRNIKKAIFQTSDNTPVRHLVSVSVDFNTGDGLCTSGSLAYTTTLDIEEFFTLNMGNNTINVNGCIKEDTFELITNGCGPIRIEIIWNDAIIC